MKPAFSVVWDRIIASAGHAFPLVRGAPFHYRVADGYVISTDRHRTNVRIARSQFERSYVLVPVKKPKGLNDPWGSSYVFAILMNGFVHKNDW